jgi:hypothetical protein
MSETTNGTNGISDSKFTVIEGKWNSYWDNLDYTVQMSKEELQWFEAIRDNDNILAAMKKQFPEVFV